VNFDAIQKALAKVEEQDSLIDRQIEHLRDGKKAHHTDLVDKIKTFAEALVLTHADSLFVHEQNAGLWMLRSCLVQRDERGDAYHSHYAGLLMTFYPVNKHGAPLHSRRNETLLLCVRSTPRSFNSPSRKWWRDFDEFPFTVFGDVEKGS
jgi:hypothetical protein